MNVYTWIFTGFTVVAVLLYIVGLARRIKGLEKAARGLLIPFTAGIVISILTEFLPDSHHIIVIAAFAFAAATLYMLSTLKDKNKFLKFAEHFLFIITQAIWFLLIVSVYRIYKIPDIFFMLSALIFIAGFVVICVFIKKQPPVKYAAAFTQYIIAAVFCTTALISLVYEKRVFGILIFCGALVNLCYVIFDTFQRTRPFAISEKIERIIKTILACSAQALLGAGAILMQV